MPRPAVVLARFGTVPAWVEARFGQQDLFDYDDLPGRADAGIDDSKPQGTHRDLRVRALRDRVPHQVERRSPSSLAGQVVPRSHRRGLPGARRGSSSWTGRPTGRRAPTPSTRDLPARVGRAARCPLESVRGRVLLRPAPGERWSPPASRTVGRWRRCSRCEARPPGVGGADRTASLARVTSPRAPGREPARPDHEHRTRRRVARGASLGGPGHRVLVVSGFWIRPGRADRLGVTDPGHDGLQVLLR